MTFSELLVQLGMETKLDLTAAARTGGCTIQFDRELDIVMEWDAATGVLQLYHALKHPDAISREHFYKAILQLHLFGLATDGGAFGMAPHDQPLFFKTLHLADMNVDAALRQVESFVNQAERWRNHLAHAVTEMSPAPTHAASFQPSATHRPPMRPNRGAVVARS